MCVSYFFLSNMQMSTPEQNLAYMYKYGALLSNHPVSSVGF